jgi:hypothetical protein
MTLMETAQLLGNVGEFVGSIAVVATLAYLAIQVRDAGRAATFAAVGSNRADRRNWFVALRDSPVVPIILKARTGEALDPDEEQRLMFHYAAEWGLIYSEWVQRELGQMGDFATSDELPLRLMLNNHSAMGWWRNFGPSVYPPPFVEHVKQAATLYTDRESPETINWRS